MIELIPEYNLGRSNRERSVQCVGSIVIQERLAEIDDFDWMGRRQWFYRIGRRSHEVFRYARLSWHSVAPFDWCHLGFSQPVTELIFMQRLHIRKTESQVASVDV